MPSTGHIITATGRGQERPNRGQRTRSQVREADVILPAGLLQAMIVARRQKGAGADEVAILLRWALWVAVRIAQTGAPLVKAGPDEVGRDFFGRDNPGWAATSKVPLERRRSGMSAKTLSRHRARFISEVAITTKDASGRYKLRRSPTFHAIPMAVALKLLYSASNGALRVAFGLLPVLSKVRHNGRAVKVKVTARTSSRGTGQAPTNFCRGVRELRILGLIYEVKRPGREALTLGPPSKTCKSGWRRPAREVLLASPLVPLGKGQIHTAVAVRSDGGQSCTSDEAEPVMPDTKPLLVQNVFDVDPTQPCGTQHNAERPGPSPSAPTPHEDFFDGARMDNSAVRPVGAASPADACRVLQPDDAGRLDRTAVPGLFALEGLPLPSRRSCKALATALGTVGALRRVLRTERQALTEHAEDPGAYLASIARAEGAAMAARDWPGSYYLRKRRAELTTPAAVAESERSSQRRTALALVLTNHGDDPGAVAAVGRAMLEAGDAGAAEGVMHHAEWLAEQARYRAMPNAAERWPAFKAAWADIVRRGEVSAYEARAWLSALALRWRGEGEAVLVAPDDGHGESLAAGDGGAVGVLAAFVAALARGDGQTWRLVLEGPGGTKCGEAMCAPPAVEQAQGGGDERGRTGTGLVGDEAGGGGGGSRGASSADRGAHAQAHGRGGGDHRDQARGDDRGAGRVGGARGGGERGAGVLAQAARAPGGDLPEPAARRRVDAPAESPRAHDNDNDEGTDDGTRDAADAPGRDGGGNGRGDRRGGGGRAGDGGAVEALRVPAVRHDEAGGRDLRDGGRARGVAHADGPGPGRGGGLRGLAGLIGGARNDARATLIATLTAQADAGSESAARVLAKMNNENQRS